MLRSTPKMQEYTLPRRLPEIAPILETLLSLAFRKKSRHRAGEKYRAVFEHVMPLLDDLERFLALCLNRWLAGVLTSFQQQYPDIDVALFEGTLQEVHEWIGTSMIDVGFVHHPAKGVESTLLTTDELQVFVARGHRLHARTSVTVSELREERLIMPKTGCEIPEISEQKRGKQGPSIRYQASEGATILAMVREGLGITILPRMMLPEKLEGIAGIPLDPPRQVQIGLAVRSLETASPGATLFVQTAVAWIQQQAFLLHRTR